MPWPLTLDEDARLARSNTKAWGAVARPRGMSVLGRWAPPNEQRHDPQLYRVGPPIPGKVVNTIMADLQQEHKLLRLWARKKVST